MPGRGRNNGGLTLIELMIVVAIIGILSSVAISQFRRYQNRAKASEAMTNIAAIVTSQKTYFTEKGAYVHVANPAPPAVPGITRTSWPSNADFDMLGWAPEGPVYFQYLISADDVGGGRFTAEAASDVDADGTRAFFGYVLPGGGVGIDGRLDGSTCAGTGVFNPATGSKSARRITGACDSVSGRRAF